MISRFLVNWPYKLASLIIAYLLFVYVSRINDPHIAKSINVPLALQSVPGTLQIADATPDVTLQLSGPTSSLDVISSSSFSATVDLSHSHAGLNEALPVVINSSAGVPQDVAVEAAIPRMASVTMDSKVRKQFNVGATFPSVSPPGLSFGTPKTVPPVASVEGTESQVNRVARLVVRGDDAVNGEAITPGVLEGFGDVVPLDSQSQPVSGVAVIPEQAELRIPVLRETALKGLIVNPTITGSPAYPAKVFSVQVKPARLVVTGSPDVLAQASVINSAPVDIQAATSDVTRQISVTLPSGVRLAAGVRPQVTVTVRISAPAPASSAQSSSSSAPMVGGGGSAPQPGR